MRIVRLKEYARRHGLMPVICSNLTESSLGYFVKQGIDDPKMGEFAPLSTLYKSQVLHLAQFLGLPEEVIDQKPAPGFGGIYDEEIVGPYELVDLILYGLQIGCSDTELIRALVPRTYKWKRKGFFMGKNPYDIQYVRFIRKLATLSDQKRHSKGLKDKNP